MAGRTTAVVQMNPAQAAMLRPVLRVHLQMLQDLLEAQVAALPPGDDSWADTSEELHQLANVLMELEGVR